MRKHLLKIGALAVFSLGIGAGPAWAADCQDFLQAAPYSCFIKAEDGALIPNETFQFIFPGTISSKFDLQLPASFLDLGCDCKAKGNFKNPNFGESTEFVCVTPPSQSEGLTIEGRAGKNRITGQMFSASTGSAVYQCELESASGV
jgi:hypothetical protein